MNEDPDPNPPEDPVEPMKVHSYTDRYRLPLFHNLYRNCFGYSPYNQNLFHLVTFSKLTKRVFLTPHAFGTFMTLV
jgi:hypothetical protein